MGLTAVVENLRALKKTVKKPIVAFREQVHQAYTKAYVGSPERVDEFYSYIKVYQPSKHNDLCMMSITADINRFSMLPDKHTHFHVHKLERHFDRMIAARKQTGVNGDMAIQILSGHNMTFMARYRRYKIRAAMKEAKRNEKRHMALNVKRHTQLPSQGSSSDGVDSVFHDTPVVPIPTPISAAPVAKRWENTVAPSSVTSKTVGTTSDDLETQEVDREQVQDSEHDDKVLAEISKAISDVVMACELTQPETVVAAPEPAPAPVPVQVETLVPVQAPESSAPVAPEEDQLFYARASQKKHAKTTIQGTEKVKVVKKFKVAKPVVRKAPKRPEDENLENVMCELSLEQKSQAQSQEVKNVPGPSTQAKLTKTMPVYTDSDSSEFDNLDTSDSDGSDIEELEKIDDKDVDDLEYEMI